jgi:membrane-associated phospholipid phosphatase
MQKSTSLLMAVWIVAAPRLARAETPGLNVTSVDAVFTGAAFAGTAALAFIPVAPHRWREEPLALDQAFRGTWSNTHARIADLGVASSLAVPIVVGGLRDDPERLEKLLVYSETISVTLLLNGALKYVVQRPRPYVYGTADWQREYTEAQGKDAYLSYFSGHSATAFAAATAGSLLYAYGNDDTTARAVLWGTEMALASATAVERVRAGKHFPSDVVVGALVGTAVGIAVPRLHMRDRNEVSLSATEWLAIAGGLAVGTATAVLLPPLPSRSSRVDAPEGRTRIVPWAQGTGAGACVSGVF